MYQQIRNPRKKRHLQFRSQSAPSHYGETCSIAGGILATHRPKSDVEDISSDDSSPGDKDDYVCNFRKTAAGNETANENEEAEPVRVLDYRTRVPRHHRVRQIEPTISDTTPEVKYMLKPQKLNKHKQKKDHSRTKGICLFRYKNQRRVTMWNNQECTDKNLHGSRTPPRSKSTRTQTRKHHSKIIKNRLPENSSVSDENQQLQSCEIFRRPSFVPDNWIHPCDPRLENFLLSEQNRPPTVYLVPQWNDMLKPSTPNFEKVSLPLPPRKAAADQMPKSKLKHKPELKDIRLSRSPLKRSTKNNDSSQTNVKNTCNAQPLRFHFHDLNSSTSMKLTPTSQTEQQHEILTLSLNKAEKALKNNEKVPIVLNSGLTTIIEKINNSSVLSEIDLNRDSNTETVFDMEVSVTKQIQNLESISDFDPLTETLKPNDSKNPATDFGMENEIKLYLNNLFNNSNDKITEKKTLPETPTEPEKLSLKSVDEIIMFDSGSREFQNSLINEVKGDKQNDVNQFALETEVTNLEIDENYRKYQTSLDLRANCIAFLSSAVSRSDDPVGAQATERLERQNEERFPFLQKATVCSTGSLTLTADITFELKKTDGLSNKNLNQLSKFSKQTSPSTKTRSNKSLNNSSNDYSKHSTKGYHQCANELNEENAQLNNLNSSINTLNLCGDLERTEYCINKNKLGLDNFMVELAEGSSEMKKETKRITKKKSNKSLKHNYKKTPPNSTSTKKITYKKISSKKTLKNSSTGVDTPLPELELISNIESSLEYSNMLEDITNQMSAEHDGMSASTQSMEINGHATNLVEVLSSIEKSAETESVTNFESAHLTDTQGHNFRESPLSDSSFISGDSLNAKVLNLLDLFNKFPQAIGQPVKSTRSFLSLTDLNVSMDKSSRSPSRKLKLMNRNSEISSPSQVTNFNNMQNTYNFKQLANYIEFRQENTQKPFKYANDDKCVLSPIVSLQLRKPLNSGNDVIRARNNLFKCNAADDFRYFEKHQSHSYQGSKYSSKRDYERDRSSYRDRDISPGAGAGGGSLNNGNSYRSQSPDIDSPSSRGGGGHGSHDIRDRGDHRGGGRGGSGERYSYIQKMRDRDRDVYKKDKYSDKRDRRGGGSGGNDRDSESYRTNHDRERRGAGSGGGAKLCSSRDNDKRSGSDDRERERDRDMRDIRDKRDRASDRDRDIYKKDKYSDKRERGDRGERVARCGDWSEHVSSSGKMYYYNCKTEVSQWEKPKEWLDRERNLPRDQHREKDYRDKDRERDRDDRFSRSAYTKHSNSRDNSRLRWNYDNDGGPPSHRRRLDGRHNENADMDISGDSTPTSEASYSLTGTPTTHGTQLNDQNAVMPPGTIPCTLGNALPRLASHPNPIPCATSSASSVAAASAAMHFPAIVATVGGVPMNTTMAATGGLATVPSIGGATIGTMPLTANSLRNTVVGTHLGSTTNATVPTLSNQGEHHLNSNAPGPPIKIMNSKDASDFLIGVPHKSTLIMRHHSAHSTPETTHHMLISGASTDTPNHVYNSANTVPLGLRDNPVNSPLYNVTHQHHSLSPLLNYTKSPIPTIVGHTNNVNATSSNVGGVAVGGSTGVGAGITAAYSCNPSFGLKTVEGGVGIGSSGNVGGVLNSTTGIGAVSGISVITSMGSNSMCSSSSLANVAGGVGHVPGEGPPTPTQELDLSSVALEQQQQQRKPVDNTSSSSLSTLQSCVGSSAQAGNMRGPEISPKLGKFYRPDLISHVTNWQAEALERQAQKCSEDTHMYGDLTCTRICAELKCARSLVRTTEINATLQEQKVMYLRQQIRRLEESKTQNSFMSDDT